MKPPWLGLAGREDEAEYLLAVPDRDAEHVGEHGMRGRPAPEARVGADVVEAERLALAQHDRQHAVLARQRTDRRLLARGQAVDHELSERAGLARHAESRIPRAGQRPG